MRIFTITILTLVIFAFAYADNQNPSSPIGFSKIQLLQEVPTPEIRKLLDWSGNIFYLAKKDGSVSEVDVNGKEILVLQDKNSKGKSILSHPEAVAVSDGIIYVSDSENNLVAMFSLQGKYLGSFGAKTSSGFFGGSNNYLSSPHGIAIRDGIVYVADTGNGRIQLYGINGVFLNNLNINDSPENADAKQNDLPYKLHEPTDIGIDPFGDVYVLDSSDYLIKVYSTSGAYLKHLPEDVKASTFSISSDGIYVTDRDTFVIYKYNFNFKNKLLYSFGSKGKGRAQFNSFSGMSTDMDRQVLVGDKEKGLVNVFKVEPDEKFQPQIKQSSLTSVKWDQSIDLPVRKLAGNGKGIIYGILSDENDSKHGNKIVRIVDGKIDTYIQAMTLSPSAIAVDRSGALWVLDAKKCVIAKLDHEGNVLFSFGTSGSHQGELDEPKDFIISDSGVVFVADTGNHRVQAFSMDGVFLKEINSDISGKLDYPTSIALDTAGGIYVLDKDRSVVSTYSSKGEPLAIFGKSDGNSLLEKPVGLMVTQDEVLILDSNHVKVFNHDGKYIRSFGTRGSAQGEFDEPISIIPTGEETFSISDFGNKRLESFTTLYKPPVPDHLAAQNDIHVIKLSWQAPSFPTVKEYRIFRSDGENASKDKLAYIQIATSISENYDDKEVEVGKTYYYRVEGESQFGYLGPMSNTVNGMAEKYVPPQPQDVKVVATEFQLKLSWQPVDQKFLGGYVVYQVQKDKVTKIGESTKPELSINGLTPNTAYNYFIVSKSTDGIESEKLNVKASTLVLNKPPLEINVVTLSNIFSNTYKLYEQDGIGKIKFTNNTDKPIERIKVSFMLNNYMDFPTEQQIDNLLPEQSQEVSIKAVFNNNILSISEDSSLQSTIEASYFQDGTRQVYTKNFPITVYDKHRMTWNEDERLASFITPKDSPIINFSRSVATQFPNSKDDTQLAAVLFDAMGVMGFTYIQNPIDPYQITLAKTSTTEQTDTVDYVQYPRETLDRRSGDCVDLVSFYSTALESIGINTLMLEVPDHLLMMFSTGISVDSDDYTMNNMYAIYEGKLWIPVETTIVGKPFTQAWELGAANYYKWKGKGLKIFDVHSAWNTYKPATLPDSSPRFINVTADDIENKYPGNFSSILKISSQTKTRQYLNTIEKHPDDMEALLQIGIILAKMGERDEAMKYFNKILNADPKNAAAVNNLGNIFMINQDYSKAQKEYVIASQLSPDDAFVWVNLAKSYMATKDTKRAKKAFVNAQRIDPGVKEKYKAMALELLNAL